MPELYQVEGGWFEVFTGTKFHFAEPRQEEISIDDIAHSLSMQCRYNGHTRFFYSVAEHSVLISDWLMLNGYGSLYALTGLLHDAAEAYIGDMVRPLKATMPAFRVQERVLDEAVALKFSTVHPFPNIVKELDTRILCDERAQAMNESDNSWGTDGLEPLGVKIQGHDPTTVRKIFRTRFNDLRAALWTAGERSLS